MKRFATVAALTAALVLTGGLRAADEPAKKADNNTPNVGGRGQLPPNFKKLGLTDEQATRVREIHATYRARIAELEQKLHDLRRQELTEEMQVLTDSQKERLKELAQERATGEPVRNNKANNNANKGAADNTGNGNGNENKNNEKDRK